SGWRWRAAGLAERSSIAAGGRHQQRAVTGRLKYGPTSGLLGGEGFLEFVLTAFHLQTQLIQTCFIEEFLGLREQLLFLLFNVVLQQFLEHLEPPGERNAARVGIQQIWKHQGIDRAMLLLSFGRHDRLFLASRLGVGWVEDFLFEGGVYL